MISARVGIAVLLLTACVSTRDGSPLGATEQGHRVCPENEVVEGIEVSSKQGDVHWRTVRSEGQKEFAYALIADGVERDLMFESHWTGMRDAGLLRGGYIVFQPEADPDEQAALVGQAVGELEPGDLPVAVFVPDSAVGDPRKLNQGLRRMLRAIDESTGRLPLLRGGRAVWAALQGADFRNYPLWHLEYASDGCPLTVPRQWDSWVFWTRLGPPAADRQGGQCAGVTTYVDLTSYNGSVELAESLALLNPSCEVGCARKGCLCVDGVCSGGLCTGTGCTTKHAAACSRVGVNCADGFCSGGYAAKGSGCTTREIRECSSRGAMCVDHLCSGGQMPGSGCTAHELSQCTGQDAVCVDHRCSGGDTEGSGCTAYQEDLCASQGASCVDYECSGGQLPGTGCTAAEERGCGAFGCGCVDHGCSGGACPGAGCTAYEASQCQERGRGCARHLCTGG